MYSKYSLDFIFMTAFARFNKVVNHAILSSVHQDHGAHRAFEMDLEHEGTHTIDGAKAKAWSRLSATNSASAKVVQGMQCKDENPVPKGNLPSFDI